MPLNYADDGSRFAIGAANYNNVPDYELSEHIVLMIEIGEQSQAIMTEAVVHTGVPYLICTPAMAKAIGLNLAKPEETGRIKIDGKWVEGGIHSVPLSFLADPNKGDTLVSFVWAFVPKHAEDFNPESLPPMFLGLKGCLNSFLFAVDPFSETFYFG